MCVTVKVLATPLAVNSIVTMEATTNDEPIEFCLFDLILYLPVNIFQLCQDGSSCVDPVLLSKD